MRGSEPTTWAQFKSIKPDTHITQQSKQSTPMGKDSPTNTHANNQT